MQVSVMPLDIESRDAAAKEFMDSLDVKGLCRIFSMGDDCQCLKCRFGRIISAEREAHKRTQASLAEANEKLAAYVRAGFHKTGTALDFDGEIEYLEQLDGKSEKR